MPMSRLALCAALLALCASATPSNGRSLPDAADALVVQTMRKLLDMHMTASVGGAPALEDMEMDMAPGPAPDMAPAEAPVSAPGGVDIPIVWDFPPGGAYPDETAQVGDSVTFTWTGFHGVYRIPDGTCPASYAPNPPMMVEVGPASSGGSATFTFEAPGDYWFACQVGSHCDGGMLIKFTVA